MTSTQEEHFRYWPCREEEDHKKVVRYSAVPIFAFLLPLCCVAAACVFSKKKRRDFQADVGSTHRHREAPAGRSGRVVNRQRSGTAGHSCQPKARIGELAFSLACIISGDMAFTICDWPFCLRLAERVALRCVRALISAASHIYIPHLHSPCQKSVRSAESRAGSSSPSSSTASTFSVAWR